MIPHLSAKLFILLSFTLFVSGCGVIRANEIADSPPGELARVNDQQVCRALSLVRRQDRINRLLAEARVRGLGDCSGAHFYCVSIGANSSPSMYTACRMQERQNEYTNRLIENDRQARSADALNRLSQQLLAPPTQAPPHYVPPRMLNCTSYRHGNTVNTSCH